MIDERITNLINTYSIRDLITNHRATNLYQYWTNKSRTGRIDVEKVILFDSYVGDPAVKNDNLWLLCKDFGNRWTFANDTYRIRDVWLYNYHKDFTTFVCEPVFEKKCIDSFGNDSWVILVKDDVYDCLSLFVQSIGYELPFKQLKANESIMIRPYFTIERPIEIKDEDKWTYIDRTLGVDLVKESVSFNKNGLCKHTEEIKKLTDLNALMKNYMMENKKYDDVHNKSN